MALSLKKPVCGPSRVAPVAASPLPSRAPAADDCPGHCGVLCRACACRAQPAGAQVIHGAATLVQRGNNLTVTTQNGAGTAHSAINWQTNIPTGSTTHFAQPGASSTSINRVVGNGQRHFWYAELQRAAGAGEPGRHCGGAGAVVDTAGFTASTLRMSEGRCAGRAPALWRWRLAGLWVSTAGRGAAATWC